MDREQNIDGLLKMLKSSVEFPANSGPAQEKMSVSGAGGAKIEAARIEEELKKILNRGFFRACRDGAGGI